MLETEILMKQKHNDEVVLLKKLIEEEKYERDCKVSNLREKIRELKDNLEYKETFLQTKEKKWSDVEKIFVEYARNDVNLQKKLNKLNYICDECTSVRKISTVIEENMELREKVIELHSQLSEAMTHQSSCSPANDSQLEAYYGMRRYIKTIVNPSSTNRFPLNQVNGSLSDNRPNQISVTPRHDLLIFPKIVKHKTEII